MNGFSKYVNSITTLSLAALLISAMTVTPAAAISLSWNGASSPPNILWSDINNWAPNLAITPADDISFTNTAAVNGPGVTNEVAVSTTINSLWYSQTDTTFIHTTQIDNGGTLKVQGFNAAIPTGYNSNFSLYAGNLATAAASVEKTVITGDVPGTGTLDVSGPNGGNTTGDIVVALGFGTAGATYPDHTAILDLSGLATFNANVDQMLVGATAVSSTSVDRPNGIVYLAQTNTITLNNALTAANPLIPAAPGTNSPPLTSLPGGGLVIGYGANRGAGDAYINALYLGQTNTINVDNVLVGGRFRPGLLAFTSKTNNSTLIMRGTSATRVASITLGDNSNNSTGGNSTAGTVDLTGGSVDIMATSIILGQSATNYLAVNTRNGQKETGTLSFNAGTIDTTGMIIANQATNLNSTTVGTVNVSGTATLTIGSGALTMSNYNGGYTDNTTTPGTPILRYYGACAPSTSTLNVSGGTVTIAGGISTDIMNLNNGESAGPNSGVTVASTINITGGSVTLGGDITKGVATTNTSGTVRTTVKIDGGILDMAGYSIGTVNPGLTGPITTLNLYSGTLKNIGQINGPDGNALVKNWDGTTAGTLILDGTNTYTGDTKVTGGTLQFAATVSIASSTIDVFGGILDVTAFGGPGYTLAGGKTLKGNGTVNGFVNVLGGTVSPGESPGTLTVGDMTFGSGSTLNIELNGATAGLFDVLNSTGALTVQPGSSLAVSLGYAPMAGDSFDIMNWGSESGMFDTLSLPSLPGGLTWDSSNLYTNGSIAVVPEPATMLMLIIAAGLCLMFKRTRDK